MRLIHKETGRLAVIGDIYNDRILISVVEPDHQYADLCVTKSRRFINEPAKITTIQYLGLEWVSATEIASTVSPSTSTVSDKDQQEINLARHGHWTELDYLRRRYPELNDLFKHVKELHKAAEEQTATEEANGELLAEIEIIKSQLVNQLDELDAVSKILDKIYCNLNDLR